MKKLLFSAALLAIAFSASGCVATTGIVSTEKRAFVVHGDIFWTTMYFCVAEQKKPVCTQVKEED